MGKRKQFIVNAMMHGWDISIPSIMYKPAGTLITVQCFVPEEYRDDLQWLQENLPDWAAPSDLGDELHQHLIGNGLQRLIFIPKGENWWPVEMLEDQETRHSVCIPQAEAPGSEVWGALLKDDEALAQLSAFQNLVMQHEKAKELAIRMIKRLQPVSEKCPEIA